MTLALWTITQILWTMTPDPTGGKSGAHGPPARAGELPTASMLAIEIVWLDEAKQPVRRGLRLPQGTTLALALAALDDARVAQALAEGRLQAAIFGKLRSPDTRLHDGDRIELLGPLTVDPKIARQRRVEKRRAQAVRDKWRGTQ